MVLGSKGLWTGTWLPAERNEDRTPQKIAQDLAARLATHAVSTQVLNVDHRMGSEGEEYEIHAHYRLPEESRENEGGDEIDTLGVIRQERGKIVCNLYTARQGVAETLTNYARQTGKIQRVISFEDTLEWLDT